MNKKELIDTVADGADLTKENASAAVDAMLDSIVATLKSGDSVRIAGFGNFEVSSRKASTGRNPRTGEAIKIPAAMVPKFKAGKALKEAVNS